MGSPWVSQTPIRDGITLIALKLRRGV